MTILHAAAVRQQIDLPANRSLMLSLSTGTFSVTDQGILARLMPPFTKLSAYYPWRYFPMGIATLKLLVADSTELADTIIDRLRLSDEEMNLLARRIGRLRFDPDQAIVEHDSEFCEDVERLIRWGVGLAERCPDKSVANDLLQLPHMPPLELDRYVRNWMG